MPVSRRWLMSCALVVAVTMATSLTAQPAATYKTGAEAYMAYRAAFAKAKGR